MIRAVVHSDDFAARTVFDATPWFRQARLVDLDELAKCGWGCDYAADIIACYMVDFDANVAQVFTYLDSIRCDPAKKDVRGFECTVNEGDAMLWLKNNNRLAWSRLGGTLPRRRKRCPGCAREFAINVIECAACGYKYDEAAVLEDIYNL